SCSPTVTRDLPAGSRRPPHHRLDHIGDHVASLWGKRYNVFRWLPQTEQLPPPRFAFPLRKPPQASIVLASSRMARRASEAVLSADLGWEGVWANVPRPPLATTTP